MRTLTSSACSPRQGTDSETKLPFFGHGQSLVLPSLKVQPPLCMEAQEQPLYISSHIDELICLFDVILLIYLL